jgi:hypothetical protein
LDASQNDNRYRDADRYYFRPTCFGAMWRVSPKYTSAPEASPNTNSDRWFWSTAGAIFVILGIIIIRFSSDAIGDVFFLRRLWRCSRLAWILLVRQVAYCGAKLDIMKTPEYIEGLKSLENFERLARAVMPSSENQTKGGSGRINLLLPRGKQNLSTCLPRLDAAYGLS